MYLSIDCGGTNTRVAGSEKIPVTGDSDPLKDVNLLTFQTGTDVNEFKNNLNNRITQILAGKTLDYICCGFPSVIDFTNNILVKTANVSFLNQISPHDLIDGMLKDRCFIQNDAFLAGVGEFVYGYELKDIQRLAYITLGTGVGGALILKDSYISDTQSYEPGHLVIDTSSNCVDNWGVSGSAEALLSGRAFENLYKIKPENCDDESIWQDYAKYLSLFIKIITDKWNPDHIIIGGGMSKKFDIFYPRLIELIGKEYNDFVPEITKAKYSQEAGILGGFAYIDNKIF